MPHGNTVWADFDAAPHYSESPVFNAYCVRIKAFLADQSGFVTIRQIHNALGRDHQRLTLLALEWLEPSIECRIGLINRYRLSDKAERRVKTLNWRSHCEGYFSRKPSDSTSAPMPRRRKQY